MITLTAGTAFIMWLGEQVTERGIGNGISLIIFSGIVVRIPSGLSQMIDMIRTDQLTPLEAILLLIFALAVVGGVVLVERGQRRVPIQHARRVAGGRVAQAGANYFPLRVNSASVIPPIFASSLLMFPLSLRQVSDSPSLLSFIDRFLNPGDWIYNIIYVVLIIFFSYFYISVTMNPVDIAENLKSSGGYIPGLRPGKRTAEYIDKVLSRLAFVGALYLSAICVLPVLLLAQINIPFYFGGTALLIVVGVALEIVSQIDAHRVSRNYESFAKTRRVRGRLGRG